MSESLASVERVTITDTRIISASLSRFVEAFEETVQLLEQLGQDLAAADSEVYEIIQGSQRNILAFDRKVNDGSVNELVCREFLSQVHRHINRIEMKVSELPNKFSRDSARTKSMVEQLKLDFGAIATRIMTVFVENRRLKSQNTKMAEQLAGLAEADRRAKYLYGVPIFELPDVVPGRWEDWREIPKAVDSLIKNFVRGYPCAIGYWASIRHYVYVMVKQAHQPGGESNRYCNISVSEIPRVIEMIRKEISVHEIVKKHIPELNRELDKPGPAVRSDVSEGGILALPEMAEFLVWLQETHPTRFHPTNLVSALARICAQVSVNLDDIDLDKVPRSYVTRQVRRAVRKYREFCAERVGMAT